jgi:hypothetical protein
MIAKKSNFRGFLYVVALIYVPRLFFIGKSTLAVMNLFEKYRFSRPATPTMIQIATAEVEIPRYPPFMKGLPAAPVERILSTQIELIQAIKHALSLPDTLYHSIAAPVITRYAAFSHLLPASESHHHRGAGGLFRHGLEVAHWATQAAQGCLFASQLTPRERKEQELRWRLAVCFAGLLHDIGKPVSDMAVVDRDGQTTWNPCDENLTDWAVQNGIEHYFLRWRDNRHKRHEQFSALVIERVLTRAARTYLLAPGPDIMQALLETIHGLDRGAKLYELVMSADRHSVERDLKAHYHTLDSAMGMPVEKYLCDAMRRLIKSGQWLANVKGARLWRFKEGLHIVWRSGAQDIVETLTKDKVPGIPRDEDTLADILIERGLAVPKTLSDGRCYRYWRMQPAGMDVTLYMLRLSSTELIFSNEPPLIVAGREINDEPADDRHNDILDHCPEERIRALIEDRQACEAPFVPLAPAQPESCATEIMLSEQRPKIPDDSTKKSTTVYQPTNLVTTNNVQMTQETSNNIDTAKHWLHSQGLAGAWLLQLATDSNTGLLHGDINLLADDDKYLLPFPETAQKLAIEPMLFIKTLEEKGWLVTDVRFPMRKVQVINQVRGILLASEPSQFMKQLMTVTYSPLTKTIINNEKPPKSNNQIPIKTVTAITRQIPTNTKSMTEGVDPLKPVPEKANETTAKTIRYTPDLNCISRRDTPVARDLIEQLRTTKPILGHTKADTVWHNLEEFEIEQCLQAHPGLKRSVLLRELCNHPDFQLSEGCIKVRLLP